jgi:hypothetical protein
MENAQSQALLLMRLRAEQGGREGLEQRDAAPRG